MINVESIKEGCTGCSACSNICPNSSITMEQDRYGFFYPFVNFDTCIDCHLCESVCMALNDNSKLFHDKSESKYFAAWAQETHMEATATSGGVISVIAKNVLEDGKVCGACFCEGMTKLQHVFCDNPEQIKKMAGSKYLQSDTTLAYKSVEEVLKSGERVLYIGTPCQVAGLRKYLKKDYNKLLTIDFLCHGVPSPLAWNKYVDFIEEKYKAKLVEYNFRAKIHGWGKIEQRAKFQPERNFKEIGPFNTYHNWFGHHLSIRSSCFHCKFRNASRVSDITVGDFWKVEEYYPDVPREQGISCVMINTASGKELFDKGIQKEQLCYKPVSYESIWEKRSTVLSNFKEPEERKKFMEDLVELSPRELLKKYPAPSFCRLFIDKIKSMVS